VDSFKVDSVATSVTFSPTGDFLATAHVDSLGIFLWANRAQFGNVFLRSIGDEDVFSIRLPTASGIEEDEEYDQSIEADEEQVAHFDPETPTQLTDKMITLSLNPKSKWQNLLNLETIKKRNKPKETPKTPERAPFFLPTLPGVDPKFVAAKNSDDTGVSKSKLVQMWTLRPQTDFITLLEIGHERSDYTALMNHLKSLNPSAIDFEIRSLSLENDQAHLQCFLEALEWQLKTRREFELVQTYLNVFLNVHSDVIINSGPLRPRLEALLQTHRIEFERLSEQIHYGLCLIGFVRNG